MKELLNIQQALCAPKSQKNEFAGFNYRSLEQILAAAKPALKANECTLTFTDDIVLVGDRYYVKATATLTNAAGEQVSAVCFAREQAQKKGLDEAQVTGTASSYARKYAACSLLAIDDRKDPDAMNNSHEGQRKPFTRGSKAWNSAVARAKDGDEDITRGNLEQYYIISDTLWAQFCADVQNAA